MESAGLIQQYITILDQSALGRELTAFISVDLEHPKYDEKFVRPEPGRDPELCKEHSGRIPGPHLRGAVHQQTRSDFAAEPADVKFARKQEEPL